MTHPFEPLMDRLERALPGSAAEERHAAKPGARWVVTRPSNSGTVEVLGIGDTRREAVERAISLHWRPR